MHMLWFANVAPGALLSNQDQGRQARMANPLKRFAMTCLMTCPVTCLFVFVMSSYLSMFDLDYDSRAPLLVGQPPLVLAPESDLDGACQRNLLGLSPSWNHEPCNASELASNEFNLSNSKSVQSSMSCCSFKSRASSCTIAWLHPKTVR